MKKTINIAYGYQDPLNMIRLIEDITYENIDMIIENHCKVTTTMIFKDGSKAHINIDLLCLIDYAYMVFISNAFLECHGYTLDVENKKSSESIDRAKYIINKLGMSATELIMGRFELSHAITYMLKKEMILNSMVLEKVCKSIEEERRTNILTKSGIAEKNPDCEIHFITDDEVLVNDVYSHIKAKKKDDSNRSMNMAELYSKLNTMIISDDEFKFFPRITDNDNKDFLESFKYLSSHIGAVMHLPNPNNSIKNISRLIHDHRLANTDITIKIPNKRNKCGYSKKKATVVIRQYVEKAYLYDEHVIDVDTIMVQGNENSNKIKKLDLPYSDIKRIKTTIPKYLNAIKNRDDNNSIVDGEDPRLFDALSKTKSYMILLIRDVKIFISGNLEPTYHKTVPFFIFSARRR